MEIIQSTPSNPVSCEHGPFALKAEEGWQISYTFIDYESKLLIVSVSIIDRSKWISDGFGGRTIPTREYKIDLKTLSVLKPEEWQKLFNYDTVEIFSEDKKYKLISTRVFDREGSNDSYTEELYDLSSGKRISNSSSTAFRKFKRENLLESFQRSIAETEESKRILDAKPTLQEFYVMQVNQLKDNDEILYYYDDQNVFLLKYSERKFILSKSGPLPANSAQWKSMKFDLFKSYDNVDDFWNEFITDSKWYLRFNYLNRFGLLSTKSLVLAKHINSFFNDLRKTHSFTYREYDKINNWSNLVWSEVFKNTEVKQWCSNCFKEVYYQPRYPKFICEECFNKDKLDRRGNLLEFSNLGVSGGFRITYMDKNGKTIREVDTEEYCECIIDNKVFFAQEAKFGGIVIQLKE